LPWQSSHRRRTLTYDACLTVSEPVIVPIRIPRTIAIRLTDSALNCPTRTAGPSTAAVVIVIGVMMVLVIPISGFQQHAADTNCADDA
jgi:hypothetical protein